LAVTEAMQGERPLCIVSAYADAMPQHQSFADFIEFFWRVLFRKLAILDLSFAL
jgi:hypothetical protein